MCMTANPPIPSSALFNLSLAKGLQVLCAFGSGHRYLSRGGIAQRTGMTRASVQRSVHTLQVLGYVGKHSGSQRFCLQPRVVELGFNYLDGHPLIVAAHSYLAQLSKDSGETVTLTEPNGQHMLYLAQVQTTQHIPVLTPVGSRVPMYASSCGRAYLSSLPQAQWQPMLEAMERPALTRYTQTQIPDILRQLQRCCDKGYAVNCEELFLGDMGIAAPIRNSRQQVVGAVHVAPPVSRWSMEDAEATLAPLVVECARAISRLTSL